jgi:hypothetical protein
MMGSAEQNTPFDSAAKPEAEIVMEIVGDDGSIGWCIVRGGEAVHTGSADGGFSDAAKTAVTQLLSMDGFPEKTTYIGHRKIRLLLNGVYPNVIKSPSDACIPPKDVRLARRRAMLARNDMDDRSRQLEMKREKRRMESKRKRYVENRLMTRLNTAVAASVPARETVAGIAWLAEDGRHAVRPLEVEPGESKLAELWALYYLLKAINAGRLLNITMGSKSAATLFMNRDHFTSRPNVYPADLIEVLTLLDDIAKDRDIIMAEEKCVGMPMCNTALRLAEFARKLHHSGGETPEQWRKIDAILLQGIGYDRNAARVASD